MNYECRKCFCDKLCVLTRVSRIIIWPIGMLGDVLVVTIQHWTLLTVLFYYYYKKEEQMIAELIVFLFLFLYLPEQIWQEFIGTALQITARQEGRWLMSYSCILFTAASLKQYCHYLFFLYFLFCLLNKQLSTISSQNSNKK